MILLPLLFLLIVTPAWGQNYNRGTEHFQRAAELHNQGQYAQAIELFNSAERHFTGLRGQQDLRAYIFLWRGLSYLEIHNYANAIEDFSDALNLASQQRITDVMVTAATKLARCYYTIDDLANAKPAYENALSLALRHSQEAYLPAIYEGLGSVASFRGNYSSAREYYETALVYAERIRSTDNIISVKTAMAGLTFAQGNTHEAMELLNELLSMPNISQSVRYADILDQMGNTYLYSGDFNRAVEYYQAANEAAQESGNVIQQIRFLIHLGGVYTARNLHREALELYAQALPLCDEYNRDIDKSVCLFNMGASSFQLGRTEDALEYLKASVALKEELRLSASGTDRLDFLASQIHTYQWLVLMYLLTGEDEMALTALEESSAKYLNEQLSGLDQGLSYSGVDQEMDNLTDNQLIINYGTISTGFFSLFTIHNQGIDGISLPGEYVEDYLEGQYNHDFTYFRENHRGLRIEFTQEELPETEDLTIDDLIEYYRLLLSNRSYHSHVQSLGRYFYDVFIAPIESSLDDKTELIIIPDNALAFLPFETLILPDGRYLAEVYDISYVQSMAVSEIIHHRSYQDQPRDFLGIGLGSYSDFNDLEQQGEYQDLPLAQWPDLDGTIEEVETVAQYFDDSTTLVDQSISEGRIKELSQQGYLRDFRILHFATHGMVLPETPGLSSLVVTENAGTSDDGYLNVDEIANLDLRAEFVNLSACETGLGKIYGGEGVVGLAQAFLVAGANSLSVSLWQVADQSTSLFMQSFYDYVVNQGLSYKEAMAETKRDFIESEEYSHPYYWAPFVFYGE